VAAVILHLLIADGLSSPKRRGGAYRFNEIQLVAQGGDFSGRNDKFRERVGYAVLLQEFIEGAGGVFSKQINHEGPCRLDGVERISGYSCSTR
jgi:hypothetical protein